MERLYDGAAGNGPNAPNDIVFDQWGGFWFTDFGKIRGRMQDRGAVYWAKADGSEIREIIFPLSMPNGIGLSPDGTRLHIAETRSARIWSLRWLVLDSWQPCRHQLSMGAPCCTMQAATSSSTVLQSPSQDQPALAQS